MFKKTFPSAIVAGICIAIAGTGYLRLGGLGGAVLFAFGLITVVYYGLRLYTGTAGFIRWRGDWAMLATVLGGNIVGCLATALAVRTALPECIDVAGGILSGRLGRGPWACFLLAIGCGFIMTTAVNFARQGKVLPLLFGVPLFIMCGFAHSIADAFYFLVAPWGDVLRWPVFVVYVCEVAGNFVGCNLYRWVIRPDKEQP